MAGGLPVGYGRYKDQMTIEAYVDKVVSGDIFDPTLSIQLKRGFTVHGIIQNYVDDPTCDNKGVFIVWQNKAYSNL